MYSTQTYWATDTNLIAPFSRDTDVDQWFLVSQQVIKRWATQYNMAALKTADYKYEKVATEKKRLT